MIETFHYALNKQRYKWNMAARCIVICCVPEGGRVTVVGIWICIRDVPG